MSHLSPAVQAVVALFRGPLAGVRFAEVDAAGLTSLASEVEAAALEIEQQEAKLTQLKQAFAQRQDALLGLAQQGLAYARIFAEGDDVLSTELEQIALPRTAKPRKATTKSTPARSDAAQADVSGSGSASTTISEPEAVEITGDASLTLELDAAATEVSEKPTGRKQKILIKRVIKRGASASAEG